jgi:hypothetical protein
MHVPGKQREPSLYFNEHQHTFGPERRVNHRPANSLSPIRHLRWCGPHLSVLHVSTSLRSLRSTPVTELRRYYGRSDSCSPGSSGLTSMNSGFFREQVSLIHACGLYDHSVSNHLAPTVGALTCYPSARPLPVSRFRLRHRHAGSSGIPGRIEFVILRTGRSPPAASHPASWRRSCIQLQAGEHMPEEDLHLSDLTRSQAHMPRACPVEVHEFCLPVLRSLAKNVKLHRARRWHL